jgi:hypothetical protein
LPGSIPIPPPSAYVRLLQFRPRYQTREAVCAASLRTMAAPCTGSSHEMPEAVHQSQSRDDIGQDHHDTKHAKRAGQLPGQNRCSSPLLASRTCLVRHTADMHRRSQDSQWHNSPLLIA